MAGIDYIKVAKKREEKGKTKEAADYYARGGNLGKAYGLYEEFLTQIHKKKFVTPYDKFIMRDIEKRFIDLSPPLRLKKLLNKTKNSLHGKHFVKGLENKIFLAITSIVFLISALFFISFDFTGYAIFDIMETDYQWISLCLFVCGLICAFVYLKKK